MKARLRVGTLVLLKDRRKFQSTQSLCLFVAFHFVSSSSSRGCQRRIRFSLTCSVLVQQCHTEVGGSIYVLKRVPR